MTALVTRFSPIDRRGALLFALRFAMSEQHIQVLFYDVVKDEWAVAHYEEWRALSKRQPMTTEDLRFVLPGGEVTRMG